MNLNQKQKIRLVFKLDSHTSVVVMLQWFEVLHSFTLTMTETGLQNAFPVFTLINFTLCCFWKMYDVYTKDSFPVTYRFDYIAHVKY